MPVERQKLMCKAWKGILKDDADFSTMTIKVGAAINLMGTAEVLAPNAGEGSAPPPTRTNTQ